MAKSITAETSGRHLMNKKCLQLIFGVQGTLFRRKGSATGQLLIFSEIAIDSTIATRRILNEKDFNM